MEARRQRRSKELLCCCEMGCKEVIRVPCQVARKLRRDNYLRIVSRRCWGKRSTDACELGEGYVIQRLDKPYTAIGVSSEFHRPIECGPKYDKYIGPPSTNQYFQYGRSERRLRPRSSHYP